MEIIEVIKNVLAMIGLLFIGCFAGVGAFIVINLIIEKIDFWMMDHKKGK